MYRIASKNSALYSDSDFLAICIEGLVVKLLPKPKTDEYLDVAIQVQVSKSGKEAATWFASCVAWACRRHSLLRLL